MHETKFEDEGQKKSSFKRLSLRKKDSYERFDISPKSSKKVKAKVGITPPHSPTSLNSFNGQPQNGYFNNGFSHRSRSMSENSDAGIDGQFKFLEGYSSPYPEVFTISAGNGSTSTDIPKRSEKSEGDSGTLASHSSHPEDKYKWTDTDSVDGTKHRKTKTRKLCIILLVTTLVIGLLAGVAVILAFKVFGVGDTSEEKMMTTIRPDIVILEGSLDLIETWDLDLDDPNSTLYIHTANNFTSEMDILMQNSEYNNSYISTTVLHFSPGSIKTRFRMNYGPSYKQNAQTDTEFARLIQNNIRTRAQTTSLNIKKETVYIGAIQTLTTSTMVPTRSMTTSSSTSQQTRTTPSSTTSPTSSTTTRDTTTTTTSSSTTESTRTTSSSSSSSPTSSTTTRGTTTTISSSTSSTTEPSSSTTKEITSTVSTTTVKPNTTTISSTSTREPSTTLSSITMESNTTLSSSTKEATTTLTSSSTKQPTTTLSSTTSEPVTNTTLSSSTTQPITTISSLSTSTSSSTTEPTTTTTLSTSTTVTSPSSSRSTDSTSSTTTSPSSSTSSSLTPSVKTTTTVSTTSSTISSSTTNPSTSTNATSSTTPLTTTSSQTSSQSSTSQQTSTVSSTTTVPSSTSTSTSSTSTTSVSLPSSTSSTITTTQELTTSPSSNVSTTVSTTTTQSSSPTTSPIVTGSSSSFSSTSSTSSTSQTTSTASSSTTTTSPSTTTASSSTTTTSPSTTTASSSTTTTSPSTTTASSSTTTTLPSTTTTSPSTTSTSPSTTTTSPSTTSTSPSTTSTSPSTTSTSPSTSTTSPSTSTTSQSTSTTSQSTSTTSPTTTTVSTTSSTVPSTTTAQDFPPVAKAGQDVSITLPKNSVFLYGNGSRDDVGVVQHQWKKLSNLPADMSGVRSSTMYVSNLVVGNYTFQLTVWDKQGQYDRDTVQVIVHPAPMTTTTTTTIPTTTEPLCEAVQFDVCRSRGFAYTLFPNLLQHETQAQATEQFEVESQGVMNQLCQEVALTYLCSLYFPKCDPMTGMVHFPCYDLCNETEASCSAYFTNPFTCEMFRQVGDNNCVRQKTTPAPPVTSTPAPSCEATELSDCRNLGFTETRFPNYFQEPNQTLAMESFEMMFRHALISPMCSDKLLFFVCSVQFPMCNAGKKKGPCRRTCRDVVSACPDYMYFFDCDSYPEIECMAPPETPAACRHDEFTCGKVTKCVPSSQRCNGENDCGDWTDEMDCECNEYQFQCDMGMCIKLYQRCDGSPQCPDNSDERECKCSHGQVACPDGKCIMSEWLCDGRAECEGGWDEMNCSRECGINQFVCEDQSCIGYDAVCDNKKDCPGGKDEWDCIKQSNGILLLKNKRVWTALCADHWPEEYGDFTCHLLGEGKYINKTETEHKAYLFFRIPDDFMGDKPSVFGPLEWSQCPAKKAVKINCEPRGCGKPMMENVKELIVNGEPATKGAWPWHVGLYYGGQYFCGGTLINENFVLTAAHCVDVYTSDFRLMTVKLGAHNREQSEVTQRVVSVEAIASHKAHVYFERNDIALLQLASPVNFTKYIQPVCLPEPGEELPLYSQCYTVGWGKTKWDGEYAEVLQELKMTLWDTQKCNSSIAWNGEVYDTFLCAGYFSGVRSICKGDSGGPLLCMDNYSTWKIIGVSSYVANYCNMTERPNIFTDVRKFQSWIGDHIECKFRCDNKKCLYNKAQVCDRVNNCGDNSDEIRECNRTISCDFEDKFLCGYTYNGWKLGYDNKLAQRTIIDGQVHTQSYAPQFDHTVGSYPGHFFYGKEKNFLNGELISPKFNLTGQTCIRFNYYLRGEISIGFKAQVIEYYRSGASTRPATKFVSQKFLDAKDEWKMGFFDLTLGEFKVKFLAGDLYKTALDDVKAIPGMCRDVLCNPSTEFRCRSSEDKCIAKQLHCDLAVECDHAYDEMNCKDSINSSYTCDFENGNLCSLRQDVGDLSDWWYVNATFVQEETHLWDFKDHTTGTKAGFQLYLNTYILQENTHVYMRQRFLLHSKQYCFSFYYQMQSDAAFNIHLDCDGCERVTHAAMLTYDGWTLFQIDLPVVDLLRVTYDVKGTENIGGFYYSYIVLDDIHVRPGVCPPYACKEGYTKCRTLNRCVPESVICDREVNCLDESDEETCECTQNEFQCTSGRCIPKDKKCNKIVECLDGSDEGESCGDLHDVSCTFEHPYMCGYQFLSYTDYTWARIRGKSPTPQTGPQEDHTLGNELGYYVYTEANQGSQGDNASLISPEFNSNVGGSLEFFYHIFSSQPQLMLPGVLRISLYNTDTGQMQTLWESTLNLYDKWQRHCLDLPSNVNGQMVFTAIRNESTIYGVDMAIDDVSLRSYSCSETAVTSTTASTTVGESTTSSGSKCGPNEWLCYNGITCINVEYRCDHLSDCPDGSDERDC